MKKYFLLAAAAATVLAVSCAKEKNQPTTDPTPTEIEDNTPQPIRFGTNIAEVKSPITKAAIENTGWGANQQLYVYAFRQTNGVPTITDAGAYIKGTLVNAPETFANHGVREPITVDRDNNHNPYYYENGVVYSFFGYYIGGANQTNLAYAEGDNGKTLSASVTIRGVDDVMLADTDKFDDYLYAKTQAADPDDVTVSIEKVYSEVSARQGVVPDLKFKHQLARFKFETMYGGNGNADDINIVNIQMRSVKAGILTIASDNGNQGFVATGSWPEHDGAPGDDGKYGFTADNSFTLKTDANNVATGNPGNGVFAPLGESIMTFPQGLQGEAPNQTSPVYHLLLTLTQKGRYQANSTTELEEFYVPMDIDFSKVVDAAGAAIPNKYAEAGKMYVIRLVIYGSEEIKMTVSLEDWEYGGETQVDPDQDTRPETTITITAPAAPSLALNLTNTTTGTITATASYTPVGGSATPINDKIKVGTSDKKVATVVVDNPSTAENAATFTVTAVGAGECDIYVYVSGDNEYQGALKTVHVTVTGGIAVPDPASTLTGVETAYTIDNTLGGQTLNLPVGVVKANDSAVAPQPTLKYASGNPAIATVDANTGVVTAVADGIVNITISWDGVGDQYAAGSFVVAVTVEHTPLPAAVITIQDTYNVHNATAGTAYTSDEFTVTTDGAALTTANFTCTEATVTVEAGSAANKFVVKTTNATTANDYTINIVGGADTSHSDGNATITVHVTNS